VLEERTIFTVRQPSMLVARAREWARELASAIFALAVRA
jgi:hypothetical protein